MKKSASTAITNHPAALTRRSARNSALAAALLLVASACGGARGPGVVEAEIARAPRGKVTVIEFVDYQCPFCRAMEQTLGPLIAEHRDRIHLVRKHVPLPAHRHAKRLAAAAICAEEQRAGEAMHEALMATDDMSPEAVRAIAQQAGLDEDKLAACSKSSVVTERLAEDDEAFSQAGGGGVPMVFIGRRKFVGLQPIEALEDALREALAEAD
jgi:protein-disulfide isomerase